MIITEKGKCGINCKACPYFKDLCPGCHSGDCLIFQCIKGVSYTGLTYPNSFCRLRVYCPKGGKPRPAPLQVGLLRSKKVAKVGFPKFVPQVDIRDSRSWFWRDGVDLPAIFAPLWQLLADEKALSEARSKGLHDYLGYNGEILLSTVMPDEMIDRLKTEDYFDLIKDLRPDAAMVPDNYTYTDVPLYQSWSQTIRLVNLANDFLDLDIPLIGLIKGADPHQIRWVIEKQVEMGYVSFAMPARELHREGLLKGWLRHVRQMLGGNHAMNNELLVYGVGQKLNGETHNMCYSNLSWFLEAKKSHCYKDGVFYEIIDPEIRYEECNCPACKGLMPQEIYDMRDRESELRILVVHNILDLANSLSR